MNCSSLIISGEDVFSKDQTKSNRAKRVIWRVPLSHLHYAALFQSNYFCKGLYGLSVASQTCREPARLADWLTNAFSQQIFISLEIYDI